MPSDLQKQIEETIVEFRHKVESRLEGWRAVQTPVGFREMELEVAAAARALADGVTGALLLERVADPALQAETSRAARAGGGLRHGGPRDVKVRLLGGTEVRCRVEYLKPNRRGLGRRRTCRHRGKGGAGFYPILSALGIWFGVTPAVAGEVSRQVADSDSVRAGRAALDRRGADLGHKETLSLVNKLSARAVKQREEWLQKARDALPVRGVLRGKRVVIATDGGRLRERRPARHGRRRTKTGHRRYDAPWREPKLLTIYVVGDDGKVSDTFQPVYDGTLGDADAIFNMLAGYLKALGAHQARELVILGDGAKWIWDRTAALAQQVGIDPAKVDVTEVVDRCHVVAVLHEIAEVRSSWSKSERAAWLSRANALLRRGKIRDVVTMIDELTIGRRAKEVSQHRDYFVRNAARMQYAAFKAAKIPTGSGAIESAVRRVVNMRMKSNGMFWLEVNAEGMLLLRSYLKAGRFDDIVNWSLTMAVPWWRPKGDIHASPLESTSAT